MARFAAFLRAINVGGHVVKMEALRKLFEALGFDNVETVIASGNVLFDSSSKSATAMEKKIEAHLQSKLGYAVETFLRTSAEMAAIVDYQPFKASEIAKAHVLYVGFLDDAPAAASKKKVIALGGDDEGDFHFHERELYWLRRKQFNETKITGNHLERTLGMPTTLRNVTTVRKIAAKLALALALVATPLAAARADSPPPIPVELTTPEGVVRELYRMVCVDKGGPDTDWSQVRNLFLPQAVVVLRVSKDASQVFDVQGWIDDFVAWDEKARVKERGFYEKILVMKPRVFRDIANVFVHYEAAIVDSDKKPTHGVDSIELVRKDGRWWIASITNDLPNAEHPLPAELQE